MHARNYQRRGWNDSPMMAGLYVTIFHACYLYIPLSRGQLGDNSKGATHAPSPGTHYLHYLVLRICRNDLKQHTALVLERQHMTLTIELSIHVSPRDFLFLAIVVHVSWSDTKKSLFCRLFPPCEMYAFSLCSSNLDMWLGIPLHKEYYSSFFSKKRELSKNVKLIKLQSCCATSDGTITENRSAASDMLLILTQIKTLHASLHTSTGPF